MTISLILYVVAERDKFNFKRRDNEPNTTTSMPSAVGLGETIRLLIYTRILIGIIVGFALNSFAVWLFLNYVKFEQLYHFQLPSGNLKVALSLGFAIVLGSFFSLVYLHLSPSRQSFYVHWSERSILSFILMAIFFANYYVTTDQFGETVVYFSTYNALLVIALLMLLVSFPVTPVDLILLGIKKLQERNRMPSI